MDNVKIYNLDAARALLELNGVDRTIRITSNQFLIRGLDAGKGYAEAIKSFKAQIAESFAGKRYYVSDLRVRVLSDCDKNSWQDYAVLIAEVNILADKPKPICYLAGPMRGYELFNFPAFDAYTKYLEGLGWHVISPANLDRENGFDPNKDEATPELMRQMITRDVDAICKSEKVFLMPGWTKSGGVKVEKALADFLSTATEELPQLDKIKKL